MEFTQEELNTEIWCEIEGYKEYFVSNLGRIKSIKNNKEYISLGSKLNGYLRTVLNRKGFFIQRLVASAFLENPSKKPIVNHINGIKTDNRLVNLEWATYSENGKHAFETGLNPKQSYSKDKENFKLNPEQVLQIYYSKIDKKLLSNHFNITISLINLIKAKSNWKSVINDYENGTSNYSLIPLEVQDLKDNRTSKLITQKKPIEHREIHGYENYEATINGDIYSKFSNKYLKQIKNKNGYQTLELKNKTVFIHYLITSTYSDYIFKPDKQNLIINHKDCNKTNNSVENLEWVTYAENSQHSIKSGTNTIIFFYKKLTENQIKEIYFEDGSIEKLADKYKINIAVISVIRKQNSYLNAINLYKNHDLNFRLSEENIKNIFFMKGSISEISKKFNVSRQTISRIKNRENYKYITNFLVNP